MFRRRCPLRTGVVTVAATLALVPLACGGDDGSDRPSDGLTAAEKAEARRVVQQFIDTDNCDLLTESFVEEEFADASDPRVACEQDETKGLQTGEYRITLVDGEAERAMVHLITDTAESRIYYVVREGGDWRIENATAKQGVQRAKLGESLKYAESYEQDGQQVEARLTLTALAFDRSGPPQYGETKSGRRWFRLRVRVKSDSSAAVFVQSHDFTVVDTTGRRHQADAFAHEPPLPNEAVAPGDVVTGYVAFQIPERAGPAEVRAQPGGSQTVLRWTLRN